MDAELEAVLDSFPVLAGRGRVVDELAGGLSNRSVRVRTSEGCYVVRLGSGAVGRGVDREQELRASAAAADVGAGPAVLDHRTDPDVWIRGWVEGRALTSDDLEDEARLGRVAQALTRLHAAVGLVGSFDLAGHRETCLERVSQGAAALPDWYLTVLPQVRRLERVLAAEPEGLVASHNDLVPGNLIDDGTTVWVIDLEHAAPNEPSFDLGTLMVEGSLGDDAAASLIAAYWGSPSPRKYARARAWGELARYTWIAWALAQPVEPGATDWRGWAVERYDSVRAALTGDSYDDLLAGVSAPR